MGRLEGKVAVVTGSGGGIGRAVAIAFAGEGARVVVNGRTPEKVDAVVREITAAGGEAIGVPGDVSKRDEAERVIDSGLGHWGVVNVLVNNAAISGPVAPVGSEDLDSWMRTLEINVFGAYLMTRAVAPVMWKAGGGKIIDVSSGAGRGTGGDLVAYRVSKAALLRMSTALAEHLHGRGIEVNSVDVFATTPMVREMGTWDDQDPVLAARMRDRAAAPEPTPADNAPIFVWLASNASDGLYGRNFAWNMNTEDLDRLKPQIMASPDALRVRMVGFDGIGLSPQGRAFLDRVKAAASGERP